MAGYISNCITVYWILDSCWLHWFIFCVFSLVSFAFDFLFLFRNSESAIFIAMFLVHASSGGRLVSYSCSSLVAIFGFLSKLLYVQVTGKVCFMSENSFFVAYIILAIVYEPSCCQLHSVLLCWHN